MTTAKWSSPAAWVDALTTELDSLVNNTGRLSAEIDNGTNLTLYTDIEVSLASVNLSAQVGPSVALYILPVGADGVSYPDATDNTATSGLYPTDTHLVGSVVFQIGTAAATHRGVLRGVVLPPGKFKLYAINKTGATLGTGNKVSYRTYGEQAV